MENGGRTAEKERRSNAAPSDGEVKRIFIGGVGAGVTADDVEKVFSALGKVHDVEFVRTNGRNFAYMDFEPNSGKSIANLFSTYTGCAWKGGKLKLEIAKEHYLTRLKREWTEDAKLASTPKEENIPLQHFSNPEKPENSQIQIYFPKLRKVKPLPFTGTGRHKYSFQRTEVPPLPIHFCDCEEHSKALETTSLNYLSSPSAVVHEKELKIYRNVINKLIGGDNCDTTSGRKMQAASGPNTSPTKEAEDSDIDDNLVMNIGAQAEDDIFLQLKGEMLKVATPTLTGQESKFGNPQMVQKKSESSKRKKSEPSNASSIKTSKRSHSAGLSEPGPAPAMTHNAVPAFSAAESSIHTPELPVATSETQVKPNQLWVQKSSWKDLVGGKDGGSFSISAILPGAASASTIAPSKPITTDTIAHPAAKKHENFSQQPKQTPQNAQFNPLVPPKAPVEEKPSKGIQEQRKVRAAPIFGTTCPFMRSAESEQQWAKAKAALSGFIKRKSDEGNASRFTKGKRMRGL